MTSSWHALISSASLFPCTDSNMLPLAEPFAFAWPEGFCFLITAQAARQTQIHQWRQFSSGVSSIWLLTNKQKSISPLTNYYYHHPQLFYCDSEPVVGTNWVFSFSAFYSNYCDLDWETAFTSKHLSDNPDLFHWSLRFLDYEKTQDIFIEYSALSQSITTTLTKTPLSCPSERLEKIPKLTFRPAFLLLSLTGGWISKLDLIAQQYEVAVITPAHQHLWPKQMPTLLLFTTRSWKRKETKTASEHSLLMTLG